MTTGVLNKVTDTEQLICLNAHACGIWGEVSNDDRLSNSNGVLHGERILSAYTVRSGVKFYIITEADRSKTSLLLPHEY